MWAWNEIAVGYAESYRSGNCEVTVHLSVEAYWKKQMANIWGSTCFTFQSITSSFCPRGAAVLFVDGDRYWLRAPEQG
jgi:hypothetical protein